MKKRVYIEDGSVAVGAARREQVVVVGLAVGPTLALEEVPGAELLVAVGAGEVLRVPCLPQGGDHLQCTQESRLKTFSSLPVVSSFLPASEPI